MMRTINRLAWATAGHTQEYCLNIVGYDHDNYITREMEQSLQAKLPGFYVCNRGSRIEINVPKGAWVDRERSIITEDTHENVRSSVEALFGPVDFEVNTVTPHVAEPRQCPREGCTESFTIREMMPHIRAVHRPAE